MKKQIFVATMFACFQIGAHAAPAVPETNARSYEVSFTEDGVSTTSLIITTTPGTVAPVTNLLAIDYVAKRDSSIIETKQLETGYQFSVAPSDKSDRVTFAYKVSKLESLSKFQSNGGEVDLPKISRVGGQSELVLAVGKSVALNDGKYKFVVKRIN